MQWSSNTFSKVVFVALLSSFTFSIQAQRNVRDSLVFSPHFSFHYGLQVPGADLAERFGVSNAVGTSFHIKTKQNIYFGAEGSFLFGNDVTEPGLLRNLLTSDNEVISNLGQISEIIIMQRGFMVTLTGGKVFPIGKSNPNSGILLKGGVGFLQHKIRLENQVHEITQLEDNYLKGYDRLTNGIVFSQFAGYFYMGNNRFTNFFAGVEAFQGFTRSRRDWNFDTQTRDDQLRTDLLLGLRIGWVIHVYRRTGRDFYYN